MLHERQLIGIVGEVVEHAFQERVLDPGTADASRSFDCFQKFCAAQGRKKVLADVQGVEESVELAAVTEEIRSHGDDDAALRGARLEEGGYKRARVVGFEPRSRDISKDLLELVDDQRAAHVVAAGVVAEESKQRSRIGPVCRFTLVEALTHVERARRRQPAR